MAELSEHEAEMQLKSLLDEKEVLPTEDEKKIRELVDQAHGKLDEEA